MPVVPFHISSTSAVARANGTASDLRRRDAAGLDLGHVVLQRSQLMKNR